MGKRTPLYSLHAQLGARIVDFSGWEMPLHYGSQIEEHHSVRRSAGVFDVSHMGVVDLRGVRVRAFLQRLLANDVGRLTHPGKAQYGCMLNESGGVLDDLIVYHLDDSWLRVVVNAGTRDKDLEWIGRHAAQFDVEVLLRADLAMLAVQGPAARRRTAAVLRDSAALRVLETAPFFGRAVDDWFVARTGYTGEDGLEIMLPATEASALWQRLNQAGVASCGLGARDTLRLEAGLLLYGSDMDESTHPFEAGLSWTVALDPPQRRFIGRDSLETIQARGVHRRLVGLLLEDRGVLRSHQKVVAPAAGEGTITSGTFSPTLQRSIALARVPSATGPAVQVNVRGQLLNARVVKPPFVRNGQILIKIPEEFSR